jgi:hypothetical protein
MGDNLTIQKIQARPVNAPLARLAPRLFIEFADKQPSSRNRRSKALCFGGPRKRVNRRKHFRRQVDTDFDDLLEGIIGPKNLCDAPVSLGIFHHRRTALEAKTPARERIDDVELDSAVVPEVLNGAGEARSAKPSSSSLSTVIEPLGERFCLPSGVTVAA